MSDETRMDGAHLDAEDGRRRFSRRGLLGGSAAVAVAGAVGVKLLSSDEHGPQRGSLLFEDDFDDPRTLDRNNTSGTALWYTDLPFNWGENTAKLTIADSVLTIEQQSFNANWALATRSTASGKGRTFGHGVFEARMRFDTGLGAASEGWPAFWSLPAPRIDAAQPRWAELDFFEAYTGGSTPYDEHFYGVVHDWRSGEPQHAVSTRHPFDQKVTSDWHTMACEWRSRHVEWFLDDRSVGRQEFGPTGARPDVQGGSWKQRLPSEALMSLDDVGSDLTVILGSGPKWPLEVDWVRVWS